MDVPSRTVQLGIVRPEASPGSIAALLPALPPRIDRTAIDAVLGLRLPGSRP